MGKPVDGIARSNHTIEVRQQVLPVRTTHRQDVLADSFAYIHCMLEMGVAEKEQKRLHGVALLLGVVLTGSENNRAKYVRLRQ